MAFGKNKRLGKKKGLKKKVVDPFVKKEWYDIQAPAVFQNRQVGKTCVNKTAGTKIASDALKGRVYEVSLGDLNKDEDLGFRKMKLKCEDVQGDKCLTNFHGMDITTDKLNSLIKKRRTLIECSVDVKTVDKYILRVFCIGFTDKMPNSEKKSAYAQSAQCRVIRKKMSDKMIEESTTCSLKELVRKFIAGVISKEIKKSCQRVYPLQHVLIRKVKVLKAPKFDPAKLMEMHTETTEDTGKKVKKTAAKKEKKKAEQ